MVDEGAIHQVLDREKGANDGGRKEEDDEGHQVGLHLPHDPGLVHPDQQPADHQEVEGGALYTCDYTRLQEVPTTTA